jgi:NifU-like protein involved in Fe-S cluster formation
MDESVIKFYRAILTAGFEYAGTLKDPDIVLDAVGESIRICDHVDAGSLKLNIRVNDGRIDEIRYLCSCDPTTNVAVEIMCALLKGRTLDSISEITPESFLEVLGSKSEDLVKKARGLIELVGKGIERYKTALPAP